MLMSMVLVGVDDCGADVDDDDGDDGYDDDKDDVCRPVRWQNDCDIFRCAPLHCVQPLTFRFDVKIYKRKFCLKEIYGFCALAITMIQWASSNLFGVHKHS